MAFRRDSPSDGRGNRPGGRPRRFESRGGSSSEGRDRPFPRRESRDNFGPRDRSPGAGKSLEMFNVTCDKCGKACKVPFRPSGSKPVFCSDCFRKEDSGQRSSGPSSSGMSQEQFKQLNEKLDKIIQALEIE